MVSLYAKFSWNPVCKGFEQLSQLFFFASQDSASAFSKVPRFVLHWSRVELLFELQGRKGTSIITSNSFKPCRILMDFPSAKKTQLPRDMKCWIFDSRQRTTWGLKLNSLNSDSVVQLVGKMNHFLFQTGDWRCHGFCHLWNLDRKTQIHGCCILKTDACLPILGHGTHPGRILSPTSSLAFHHKPLKPLPLRICATACTGKGLHPFDNPVAAWLWWKIEETVCCTGFRRLHTGPCHIF